jgi:hypothetical protein
MSNNSTSNIGGGLGSFIRSKVDNSSSSGVPSSNSRARNSDTIATTTPPVLTPDPSIRKHLAQTARIQRPTTVLSHSGSPVSQSLLQQSQSVPKRGDSLGHSHLRNSDVTTTSSTGADRGDITGWTDSTDGGYGGTGTSKPLPQPTRTGNAFDSDVEDDFDKTMSVGDSAQALYIRSPTPQAPPVPRRGTTVHNLEANVAASSSAGGSSAAGSGSVGMSGKLGSQRHILEPIRSSPAASMSEYDDDSLNHSDRHLHQQVNSKSASRHSLASYQSSGTEQQAQVATREGYIQEKNTKKSQYPVRIRAEDLPEPRKQLLENLNSPKRQRSANTVQDNDSTTSSVQQQQQPQQLQNVRYQQQQSQSQRESYGSNTGQRSISSPTPRESFKDGRNTALEPSASSMSSGASSPILAPAEPNANELDYPLSMLHTVPFSQLTAQPFDTIPGPDPFREQLPADLLDASLTTAQKITLVRKYTENTQRLFFSSLSADEWEQGGEWFLERFAEMVQRIVKARKEKRELAKEFEVEVEKREEIVRKRQEDVESALKDMKRGGLGVLGMK